MNETDTIAYLLEIFRNMKDQVYIWRPNVPGQHEYMIVKDIKFNGEELFIGTVLKYPRAGTSQKVMYNEADVFLEAISQQDQAGEAEIEKYR